MAEIHSERITLQATIGSVRVVGAASPLSMLARRPAVGVDGATTLAQAAEAMRAASVSALLVHGLGGIVTERDLTQALAAGRDPSGPVAMVTTSHPLVVPDTMTLVTAAGVMLNEEVRHLVVERESGMPWVISMRDIFAVLLQAADPHLWLSSLRVAIESPAEIWLG